MKNDFDPDRKVVRAIHTIVLPIPLNTDRMTNIAEHTENLEYLGYELVSIGSRGLYVVFNKLLMERTGRLYMYSCKDITKHLIGKAGRVAIGIKADLENRGYNVVSVSGCDVSTVYPRLKDEDITLPEINKDNCNKVNIGKDHLSLLPLDIMCSVDKLTTLIKACLSFKENNTYNRFATTTLSTFRLLGGTSAIRSAIALCKAIDDASERDRRYIADITNIDFELGFIQSIFLLHWERISTQPFPFDV